MDRGAWQAIVHSVAESDTTEVTEHIHRDKVNKISQEFVSNERTRKTSGRNLTKQR